MVQAPCGAFWSIDLRLQMDDSRELAAEALRSMRQDYADLEAEPVTEQVGGMEAVGYNLHFYYMDFIISARIRSLGRDRPDQLRRSPHRQPQHRGGHRLPDRQSLRHRARRGR